MAKPAFQSMLRMVAAKKADFLTQQAAKIGPWPAEGGFNAKDHQQRLRCFEEQTEKAPAFDVFFVKKKT